MSETNMSALEILTWYSDAGVDVAMLDEPVDRFVEAAAKRPQKNKSSPAPAPVSQSPALDKKPSPPPRPAQSAPAIPDSKAIALANEAANAASNLKELHQAINNFQSCNLKFNARSTVFAEGNSKTGIMLVGGTPGREEDAQGAPFVGPVGQLLDRMLAAIGLTRTDIYLSNCAPWRPPGGRTMTPAETEICRPFLERHIQLADPDMLILAGGVSSKMLLKSKSNIMSLRGKWTEFQMADRALPTLPMLSPDYLLKNPNHKNLAWQDLLSIRARLKVSET